MPHLLIDADACPVRAEAIAAARRHGWPVVLVAGPSQVLAEEPGVSLVQVDSDSQAADVELANRARRGDVVVTGDYGLAALALAKGARVVCFRGRVLHGGNIDALLATRHLAARAGRRGSGPLHADPRGDPQRGRSGGVTAATAGRSGITSIRIR